MITLYNFKTLVSINFAIIKVSGLMVSFVLHLFKMKDLASLYFPLVFTHWRLPFGFLLRAYAWTFGLIPSKGYAQGSLLMFLSLSFFPPPSISKINNNKQTGSKN